MRASENALFNADSSRLMLLLAAPSSCRFAGDRPPKVVIVTGFANTCQRSILSLSPACAYRFWDYRQEINMTARKALHLRRLLTGSSVESQ
jgi:hypothetical protein